MFSALVLSQPTPQPGEQKAQGDLTKVYKNLRWGWGEKDKARDFSVLCTDRARGNEYWNTENSDNYHKDFFYYAGGQTLQNASQRGCGVPFTWRYLRVNRMSYGQSSPADFAWAWHTECHPVISSKETNSHLDRFLNNNNRKLTSKQCLFCQIIYLSA